MESSKSRPTEGQAKREKLFDYFSKNLATVKRHPKLHLTPEFEDGVICPMCFKLFTREGLSSDFDDRLTLEDVPPIALGGQPLLLTCKVCNNKAGSQLEAHLTRMLEMPGDQYQNLVYAQKAALKATAADLVEIVRSLLVSGVLIVDKGKIIPNPDKISQNDAVEHIWEGK